MVIRKAGANGVAGEQQAKRYQGLCVNLPQSPVAPAHTGSRGGLQLWMLSRDVGVQDAKVIISTCASLSHFNTVIKLWANFWENEGEKRVWLLTENSQHECVTAMREKISVFKIPTPPITWLKMCNTVSTRVESFSKLLGSVVGPLYSAASDLVALIKMM